MDISNFSKELCIVINHAIAYKVYTLDEIINSINSTKSIVLIEALELCRKDGSLNNGLIFLETFKEANTFKSKFDKTEFYLPLANSSGLLSIGFDVQANKHYIKLSCEVHSHSIEYISPQLFSLLAKELIKKYA